MGRAKFSTHMMEPLESRQLMSVAVAASTTPGTPASSPPAQQLYQDPFIDLSLNGKRLGRNAVVSFGRVAQGGEPVTKTISLFDTQGDLPLLNDALNFGPPKSPADFTAVTALAGDNRHATLTVTFTPVNPGKAGGTIVIFVNDGSNYVIALNVRATVLPTAAVSVTRIDMARQPPIAGGTRNQGLARVQLTNNGPHAESGATTVELYATSSDTLDTADAILLGKANQDVTINAGKTKPISVHFNYPILKQSGDFHIFAIATGPTLIASAGGEYSSPIMQPIEAPEINLSGIATQSPAFLTHNTTRIAVPIANLGNVDAYANVQLNIYTLPPSSEPGASSSPSLLGTFNLNYSIRAGRKAIHTLHIGHGVLAGWEIIAEITAIHMPPALAAIDVSALPDSFAVR